jgi:hypothetical protein
MKRVLGVAAAALLYAGSGFAQQRPLVTEDPETVGAGRVLLEGGVDYARSASFPAAGLTGNELRFPVAGVSVGVSSIAELQIDGAFWSRLNIVNRRPAPLSGLVTASETTNTFDDVVVATKVRLLSETPTRPSAGIRFGMKLPTASEESGIGLGTNDFFASFLLAKTVQSVRIVGNGGIGVFTDPTRGDHHNHEVLYGISFARAVSNAMEVVGEITGHASTAGSDEPPGTDSRGAFRLGARYTMGMLRLDAGLLVGLTARDPSVGFTTGFTYVFSAFQLP